jgi:Phage integrase, N-terminal SAM-like domain
MLSGWRAQQMARGLRECTIVPRERLVRRFLSFTSEYPWQWQPAHVDEWTQSLTGEKRLAPSTIRGYQTDLRLFSEYLCDGRCGAAAHRDLAAGCGGLGPQPGCAGVRQVRHAACPLRQGGARAAAPSPQRALGDGLGGGGGDRLRGEHPAEVRLRRSPGALGDRP